MAFEPRAYGPINLGSGRARSVADVVAAIEAATGASLHVEMRRVDDPYEASQASLDRLRACLDWSPGIDLEAGIDQVVAHERDALVASLDSRIRRKRP